MNEKLDALAILARELLHEAVDLPDTRADDRRDIAIMTQAILDRVYQIRIALAAIEKKREVHA